MPAPARQPCRRGIMSKHTEYFKDNRRIYSRADNEIAHHTVIREYKYS